MRRFLLLPLVLVATSLIAQPVITGISPTEGPTSGGTEVTIYGSGFALSAAPQSATELEQILSPFDSGMIRGTRGAAWSVELRVRNETDESLNLFPGPCFSRGNPVACWTRIDVAPRQTTRIDQWLDRFDTQPQGLFLYVPKQHAGRVHFSLFLKSLNAADDVGVSVPVVPESEYRTRAVIAGVPVRADDRRTLRLYEPTLSDSTAFDVTVISEADERIVCQQRILAFGFTDMPHPLVGPRTSHASACLSGDALKGVDSVTVVVERPAGNRVPFWPMLSVTSNIDDRVSIFVPGR